jgi:hypothetical protein
MKFYKTSCVVLQLSDTLLRADFYVLSVLGFIFYSGFPTICETGGNAWFPGQLISGQRLLILN